MADTNIEDIYDFYNSPALHRLQSLSCRKTFLEVCGKRTSETAHSAFLKWLFENDEFARLPLSPIITLLRLYTLKALEQGVTIQPEHEDLIMQIRSGRLKKAMNVEAQTEVVTPHKRKIDLELTVTLSDKRQIRICLENKLYTKEHDNQCEAYWKYYNEQNDGIPTVFIFLSPEESNKTNNEHYVHLLYQDLYDGVLNPLYEQYREHHSNRSVAYLKDYIETLTSFGDDYKPIVMSNEYQQLLKEIYDNHKDIFLEALRNYGEDDEKKIVNDKTYRVAYENQPYKTAVGYTKFARTVTETLLANGVSASDIINNLEKVDINGFDKTVVFDMNTPAASSRYQTKNVEGKFYISNQWNKDKADSFKRLVEATYPKITIS